MLCLHPAPHPVPQISIRDPERVEVARMGVPVGAYLTYLVRTEALPKQVGCF